VRERQPSSLPAVARAPDVVRAFRASNGYARAPAAPTSVQHATLRRPLTSQREAHMKGDPQIIDLLNRVLTAELTTINQYFIHARMCENWGYERLWKKVRAESIDEMKHADELIARILYLDGIPNLQRLGKVNVGETVPEQFRLDLDVEKEAIKMLNEGIETARAAGDNGSRDLLEKILHAEEEHANWLEAQLTLIAQVGEQNYLSQQIKEEE
jgi:bacterioferritin